MNLKTILKSGIVFIVAGYVVHQAALELAKYPELMSNISWFPVLLSIFLAVALNAGYVSVWQSLTRELDCELPLTKGAYIWATSELGKYVPGKIWLVLGKVYFYRRAGKSSGRVLSAGILEGAFTVGAQFILGGLLIVWRRPDLPTPALLLGGTLVLAALAVLVQFFPYEYSERLLSRFWKSAKFPRLSVSGVTRTLSLSLLSQAILAVSFALLALSLWNFSNAELIFLCGTYLLSSAFGSISFLAPGGFGAREGALLLGISQIAGAPAASIVVVARVWNLFTELLFIGLVWGLFRPRISTSKTFEAPPILRTPIGRESKASLKRTPTALDPARNEEVSPP